MNQELMYNNTLITWNWFSIHLVGSKFWERLSIRSITQHKIKLTQRKGKEERVKEQSCLTFQAMYFHEICDNLRLASTCVIIPTYQNDLHRHMRWWPDISCL